MSGRLLWSVAKPQSVLGPLFSSLSLEERLFQGLRGNRDIRLDTESTFQSPCIFRKSVYPEVMTRECVPFRRLRQLIIHNSGMSRVTSSSQPSYSPLSCSPSQGRETTV